MACDEPLHATHDGLPARLDASPDLSSLAWVLDELRKSLDATAKCLQRYRREADAAGAPFHVPGLQHLLQAGQLLHQCAGALHLVQQTACAALADAMESAVQRFAEQQQPCTDEAVAQIEQAGIALTEYLQSMLAGKPVAPVELFPQYREVRALAGAARAHPVELWNAPALSPSPSPSVPLPADAEPLHYAPALRSRFDQAVLKLVKTADPAAAQALHDLALGLAAGSAEPSRRTFWHLAAAYFQALALGLVPADLYTKRIASGVLTQYAALARGEAEPTAALVHELLFYCARAMPPDGAAADTLASVRAAHGLDAGSVSDYTQRRFGRFNAALLAQARKRIATASETWSAVAGGDAHKLKAAHEQFLHMADALGKLHDDSAVLTQALVQAAEAAWRVGGMPPAPPAAALTLEVATALLYLDTAYADLDRSGAGMRQRATLLADRLAQVQEGGAPAPLQGWMEALYRGVSEPQTMGSVAAELGSTLADVEQALDQFFRAPREKAVLGKVLVQLAQMHGVLSVLELAQAARAVSRMHATVEGYMADAADDAAVRTPSFERLGSSLTALGDMVGMLGYQHHLAQTLFIDDEEQGLLRRSTSRPVFGQPAAAAVQEQGTPHEVAAEADAPTAAETLHPPTAVEAAAPPLPAAAALPPDWAFTLPPEDAEPSQPDLTDAADLADDQDPMRQIGPLRIALPLYNAFLNDADEWSRRLQTELGEWALQQPAPPAQSSAALARSLADSATGVGFDALAQLADLLSQVLQHLHQAQAAAPQATPPPTQPALDAAEEIRRLLHQFAAGFLKPARETVVQALHVLLHAAPAAAVESATTDAVDADLLLVFEDEAAGLLPGLSAALRQWHAAPADTGARQQVLRTLHTLKGGARLAGALQLSALAHRLESAANQLTAADATPQQIEPLQAQADQLQLALDHLRAQVHRGAAPQAEAGETLTTRVRIAARLGQFSTALTHLDGPLDRMRSHLRELELHSEAQMQMQTPMQTRLTQTRESADAFDPLAFDRFTRTQELARSLAESLAEVAAVQQQLRRTLQDTEDDLAAQGQQAHARAQRGLVAFEAIAERLHRVVQHSAENLDRQVQLAILGGSTEIDGGLLDGLAPVLDHLLRNAVAHGIEDAHTRTAAGKPAAGTVTVKVAHTPDSLAIAIHDDGRGLDLPRLQAAAESRGLLPADTPLTPAEATALVFLPGVTTSKQLTELAGRGIGMDVVRTDVQALGGRIETESTPGVATQFKLVLPLQPAHAPGLRNGDSRLA